MTIEPKSQCCLQSIYDFHNEGAERLGAPDSCIVKMLRIEPENNVIIKIIKLATIFFTAIVNLIGKVFCCYKEGSAQRVITVLPPVGSDVPPRVEAPEEEPAVEPPLRPEPPVASSQVSDDSSTEESETEDSETEVPLAAPEVPVASSVISNDSSMEEPGTEDSETEVSLTGPEVPVASSVISNDSSMEEPGTKDSETEVPLAAPEVPVASSVISNDSSMEEPGTKDSETEVLLTAPEVPVASSVISNDSTTEEPKTAELKIEVLPPAPESLAREPEVVELEAAKEELLPATTAFPLVRTAVRLPAPQPSSARRREFFQQVEAALLRATLVHRLPGISLCEVKGDGQLIPLIQVKTVNVLNSGNLEFFGNVVANTLISSLNSGGNAALRTAAYGASCLCAYSGAVGLYAALTAPVVAVTTLGAVAGAAPVVTSSAFLVGSATALRSLFDGKSVLESLYSGVMAPFNQAKKAASFHWIRGQKALTNQGE